MAAPLYLAPAQPRGPITNRRLAVPRPRGHLRHRSRAHPRVRPRSLDPPAGGAHDGDRLVRRRRPGHARLVPRGRPPESPPAAAPMTARPRPPVAARLPR